MMMIAKTKVNTKRAAGHDNKASTEEEEGSRAGEARCSHKTLQQNLLNR